MTNLIGNFKISDENQIPGLLLLLDLEKAVNSLEWNYLELSLKKFGFEKVLLDGYIYYNDITSCIMNKGNFLVFLPSKKGSDIYIYSSSYLFISAIRIPSASIELDPRVNGLNINETDTTISQIRRSIYSGIKRPRRNIVTS